MIKSLCSTAESDCRRGVSCYVCGVEKERQRSQPQVGSRKGRAGEGRRERSGFLGGATRGGRDGFEGGEKLQNLARRLPSLLLFGDLFTPEAVTDCAQHCTCHSHARAAPLCVSAASIRSLPSELPLLPVLQVQSQPRDVAHLQALAFDAYDTALVTGTGAGRQ